MNDVEDAGTAGVLPEPGTEADPSHRCDFEGFAAGLADDGDSRMVAHDEGCGDSAN